MAIKNPVLFWIFSIFVLANILDAVTAWFILPGESNPLFIFVGSIWIVYVVKFGFVAMIGYWVLKNIYTSHFALYLLIMILTLGTLVVGLGAYSNILGIKNPEIIEYAASVPTAEKLQGFAILVTVFYYLPFAFSLIGFWLYRWSLKYTEIQNVKKKKNKTKPVEGNRLTIDEATDGF